MARKPGIWQRSGRGWYTKIGGKQVHLGTTRAEANRRFRELMQAGNGNASSPRTVSELVTAWLADCRSRVAPSTLASYRASGKSFASLLGDTSIACVTRRHAAAWLDAHPSWGRSSRSIMACHVKILFRWAIANEYLERSPLAGWNVPGIIPRTGVSLDDFESWRASMRQIRPDLADWVTFAVLTGCRPGEQRKLESRHVAQDGRSCVVEGKTGKRTVFLCESAGGLARGLQRDSGPIFCNTLGRPWNHRALGLAFRPVSEQSGIHVTPYSLRGLFGSILASRGVDLGTIATLYGHSSPTMAFKHYVRYQPSALLEALERAAG
jgi:integrase